MTTVPMLEQSATKGDPTQENAADLLAEATLAMIGGGRNFQELSDQQAKTFQEVKEIQEQAQATPEAIQPTETPEPTPEPEVETPVEEVAETPEEIQEEPEPPAGDPPPTEPASEAPTRFRFSNEEDRAVAQLARAKNISLVKAAELYAKLTDLEPTPEPVVPVVATSPKVQALEVQAAQLEAYIKDGDNRLTDEYSAKLIEFGKVSAKLERAQMEAEQQDREGQAFDARRNSVMQDTVKAYPDMAKNTTALYLVAARLADEAASNPKHPDYQAGISVDAPRYFADKAASILNQKPVTKTAPVKATKTATTTPVSGNRHTQPAPVAKPATEQIESKLAQTLAMIGGGGEAASTLLVL